MALEPTTSPISEEPESYEDQPSSVSHSSLSDDHRPHISHVSSMDSEAIRRIREASLAPTPISKFLSDPDVASILSRPKKSRRASTNSLRDRASGGRTPDKYRDRERDGRDDTSSLVTLILAEEEKSSYRLKTMLRSTTDRLEHELRRSDQAEARAQAAEKRAIAAQARITISEAARVQADADASRARDEMRRVQMLLEAAQKSVQRVEEANRKMEERVRELERGVDKAEERARRYQGMARAADSDGAKESAAMQAAVTRGFNDGRKMGRDEGYEEGFVAGRDDGYEEGRVAGFQEGRFEGYEEGRSVGREEGFEDGREEGRKEEREQALMAFNQFVDEYEPRESTRYDRTQEWVRGTSAISEEQDRESERARSQRSSAPRPIWLHRRLHTDPVVPSRA